MSWLNFGAKTPATTTPATATSAATTPQSNDAYRLALAKALMQSGTEPTETKKAGRFAVPTSPLETLGKLAQSATAAYMMKGQ
jgi:hypothetical protein